MTLTSDFKLDRCWKGPPGRPRPRRRWWWWWIIEHPKKEPCRLLINTLNFILTYNDILKVDIVLLGMLQGDNSVWANLCRIFICIVFFLSVPLSGLCQKFWRIFKKIFKNVQIFKKYWKVYDVLYICFDPFPVDFFCQNSKDICTTLATKMRTSNHLLELLNTEKISFWSACGFIAKLSCECLSLY